LVDRLIYGKESCKGAQDSRLNANIEHIFFIFFCGFLGAKVFGLDKRLDSKTVNDETKRKKKKKTPDS
jgi:hypothetical protein